MYKFQNTIYIVRHGESVNNVLEIYNSCLSTMDAFGLTDNGRDQIQNAANGLENIHKIFTSPFRRTRETAEIFQLHHNADLHIDHRLREIDLGTLHGETHIDLPFFEIDEPIFGGESIDEIRGRMIEMITEIDAQHQGKNLLLVSHGGPIEILKHYLQNPDPFQFSGIAKVVKNGEVTLLS